MFLLQRKEVTERDPWACGSLVCQSVFRGTCPSVKPTDRNVYEVLQHADVIQSIHSTPSTHHHIVSEMLKTQAPKVALGIRFTTLCVTASQR